MATKIVTKNSSTASAVPTASDLVQGELAVNVADKRLFTEDNGGSVIELGTNPYNFTANHDGSAKLATTATGIDVTGTATMDGLTVDGNVGINNSSPPEMLTIGSTSDTNVRALFLSSTTGAGTIQFGDGTGASAYSGYINYTHSDNALAFATGSTERARIDSAGRLGLGVTPEAWSSVFKVLRVGTGSSIAGESGGTSTWFSTNAYYDGSWKRINTNTSAQIGHTSDGKQEFKVAAAGSAGGAISWNTAMTVDNSGNVLVGKGATSQTTAGTVLYNNGQVYSTTSGTQASVLTRLSSDGPIQIFYKDSSEVGSIGNYGGLALDVGKGTTAVLRFRDSLNSIYPAAGIAGGTSDGVTSLGISSGRFNDIYATNGTIQTSDRNEKQDIAELSDAEQRVAVAAKGLLRKFRWKDSVAEKGDEARTHFGIIAQDLQAAFAAEGLDAGDYAMFISSTWTDEETNEEKTRMGVRYSELLAFIISAI